MLKLGSQTGSLINHVMSRGAEIKPKVGMGATFLGWSDRDPYTITEIIDDKTIRVVADNYKRTDNNGMSETQEYEYSPGTGEGFLVTLRKNGKWIRKGDSIKGSCFRLGVREKYYDFSF